MIRCLKDKTNTKHEFCKIKKVSMHVFVLLYNTSMCQHLYSTLWVGGEGVRKKSTLCMLAKKQKIVDHPLADKSTSKPTQSVDVKAVTFYRRGSSQFLSPFS